jgi:hypothetical protein
MPRAEVRHPFSQWAAIIGGILNVNGFEDFLANYSMRRTADDPIRHALGILGAAHHLNGWKTATQWAEHAVDLGIHKAVILEADQGSEKGRERGMGVILSDMQQETFHAETETQKLTMRLEKSRRRFETGQVSTRYRFVLLEHSDLPEDPVDGEGQQ